MIPDFLGIISYLVIWYHLVSGHLMTRQQIYPTNDQYEIKKTTSLTVTLDKKNPGHHVTVMSQSLFGIFQRACQIWGKYPVPSR